MAIDRKEIVDKVFFGIGTVGYGTIAPSHFAYDANFKPFEKPDPEGAKKLVAEVGKGPLSFELLVSAGDPFQVQLASFFQAQLKKADIDVEIKQLEFAQILKLQTDKAFPGMTQIGWSGRIDPDPNIVRLRRDAAADQRLELLEPRGRQAAGRAARRGRRGEAQGDAAQGRADLRRSTIRPASGTASGVAQLLTSNRVSGLEPYPDQIIRFQYAHAGESPSELDASRAPMTEYIVRRIVLMVPVAFLVTIIIFVLVRMAPGDPVLAYAGEERDPEQLAGSGGRSGWTSRCRSSTCSGSGGRPRATSAARSGPASRSREAILERLGATLELGLAAVLLSSSDLAGGRDDLGAQAQLLDRHPGDRASRSAASRCRTSSSGWC